MKIDFAYYEGDQDEHESFCRSIEGTSGEGGAFNISSYHGKKSTYININGYGTGWKMIPDGILQYIVLRQYEIVTTRIDSTGFYILCKRI